MIDKKAPQADMERQRATGFLLGLVLVLAVLYVALEWNSAGGGDDVEPLDLSELTHESELVPMSNVETQALPEATAEKATPAERLRVVDDVELVMTPDSAQAAADDGTDDETLLRAVSDSLAAAEALAALEVDPSNPLNFHIAEDLPQFPGGAVEFMKWLTRNLRYPKPALTRKVQGRVVAVFYVEKDGTITGLNITEPLSPECDKEALRVLRMMPRWKPGIQHDQPCRTKVCLPIVFKI